MKPERLRAIALVAAVLALLGAGAAIGMLAGDDSGRVRPLEQALNDARAEASAASAARDRLRVERDQLEARLAARRAPAICPDAEASTDDADLLDAFAVSYPCGWHALVQAGQRTPERAGLVADVLLLSRLPIVMRPGVQAADVELADWTDDPADEEEQPLVLSEWVDAERTALTDATARRIAAGDGLDARMVEGGIGAGRAVVILIAFEDRIDGSPHIVRLFSLDPSRRVREAMTRAARTFTVLD